MDGIVVFCSILASELKDYFLAARVIGEESGDIVDVSVEDYPATLWSIVLCN